MVYFFPKGFVSHLPHYERWMMNDYYEWTIGYKSCKEISDDLKLAHPHKAKIDNSILNQHLKLSM